MPEIKPSEHIFIGGRTGSGKTFLAKKYLAGFEYVVALDTKGTLSWREIPGTKWHKDPETDIDYLVDGGENLSMVTELSELTKAKTPKIIYRPNWAELNPDYYNAFFEWVYRRGNNIVWIDEAFSVSPNPHKIPEFYKAILTRGRELRVAAWSLSQRPHKIAQEIMSEATHYFIFDMNLPADRDKVADITGQQAIRQKPGQFNFWYYNVVNDDIVKARLKPKRKGADG